ncbi:MAG: cyclodeaminase/cyclohydrolase family protein [Candidatus Falkowbacteria bacterium]
MKKIKDMTVEEFLRDLASDNPAPGGGSASAVAGAMAAALVAFVCRKTIGKKRYAAVEAQMKGMLDQAEGLAARLLVLAEEDKAAFQRVIAEKYSAESLKGAASIPAETEKLSRQVFALAIAALQYGYVKTQTDAQVASLLAEVAATGARLNVNINEQN